jgi:glycosyltransferase involved in cell wall biosynthesis
MPGEHETFGLVALEAAACGTPVAACSTAPALQAIGALGHGFVPADPDDLDRTIAQARAAEPDPQEAAMVARRHRWDRVLRAETAALRDLVA